MAEIKLTKNELRTQQNKLNQLKKYLPTLQLKKAMLQTEVSDARLEIMQCEKEFNHMRQLLNEQASLLTEQLPFDIFEGAKVKAISKRYENIAGVEVPYFDGIEFHNFSYSLFDSPWWVDSLIMYLRRVVEAEARVRIAEEKKSALEKELREVSIRVNLFEKILIPRAVANIKKIKIFLGDQQLAAVSQAKVAKAKIEKQKMINSLS